MSKKVKLAIFDKDLRARTVGKFELSDNGEKIKVRPKGKGKFTPTIDNESFIEFPRRSPFPPFRIHWDKVYFVRRGANACVNFKTGKVEGPDPEQVMEAARSEILANIGKEKQEIPFILWIILAVAGVTLLKVLGVIA